MCSEEDLRQLAELLQAVVAQGASVGFLADLSAADARSYWAEVDAALGADHVLHVERIDGRIVATGQLVRCTKPNGHHRAEVAKVLVHPDAQGRGLGRTVMEVLEGRARSWGLSLLVLDTLSDSVAESLYTSMGWQPTGRVPAYAGTPDGVLQTCTFMWKALASS